MILVMQAQGYKINLKSNTMIKITDKAMEAERLNIRLSLIDDYFKARRLLAAWDIQEHIVVLTDAAGDIFDSLYEMDIKSLEGEIDLLQASISEHMYRLHGIRGKRG
jgi:hypothetical protein